LIDHTKACREVSTKLAMHISSSKETRHRQLYQEVGAASSEIVAGVAWLLVLKGAEIPEDEEFILSEQERIQDLIAEWLAPEEEEGEEGPTPEGLRERLEILNANETMLPGYDEIIEYVFGPQDESEPEAEPETETAPQTGA
jgi:hypothetical protein